MALLLIQILTFSEQIQEKATYYISYQNCIYITSILSKNKSGFSWGPLFKTLASNARGMSLIPG